MNNLKMSQPQYQSVGSRQQINNQAGQQQMVQGSQNAGSTIDELESSFRACITPFVSEEASVGVTFQDEQRPSVELAINEFIELARKTEAYFQKQRVIIATRKPELILKDEIQDLEAELKRKDEILRGQMSKLKTWQNQLKEMLNSGSEVTRSQPSATHSMR